jgi:hypothetical protein
MNRDRAARRVLLCALVPVLFSVELEHGAAACGCVPQRPCYAEDCARVQVMAQCLSGNETRNLTGPLACAGCGTRIISANVHTAAVCSVSTPFWCFGSIFPFVPTCQCHMPGLCNATLAVIDSGDCCSSATCDKAAPTSSNPGSSNSATTVLLVVMTLGLLVAV